jgi:hypothetical protein
LLSKRAVIINTVLKGGSFGMSAMYFFSKPFATFRDKKENSRCYCMTLLGNYHPIAVFNSSFAGKLAYRTSNFFSPFFLERNLKQLAKRCLTSVK